MGEIRTELQAPAITGSAHVTRIEKLCSRNDRRDPYKKEMIGRILGVGIKCLNSTS